MPMKRPSSADFDSDAENFQEADPLIYQDSASAAAHHHG